MINPELGGPHHPLTPPYTVPLIVVDPNHAANRYANGGTVG